MNEPRELRFISFRVGAETFLADIMAVRQIVIYGGSTAVPSAPPFIPATLFSPFQAPPGCHPHP